MQAFVDEFGLEGFPHAVDEDGSLWARFEVPYQPAWIFVDERGRETRHLGPLGAEGIGQRIQELMDG